MARKNPELVSSDGARMGRDADGAYIIASDGSYMRSGKAGLFIVSGDGSVLSKPAVLSN